MRAGIPVALLNDTRVDRHHGCQTVMTRLERLLAETGFTVAVSVPAHRDWAVDLRFREGLRHARLLIINGEGTIHHDHEAGRRLLEAGAAARAEGVPAALINALWEGNGPGLTAKLADFALVSLRDSHSAARVRSAGIGCRMVPDLSLHDARPFADVTRRAGIGFTDNVDRFRAIDLDRCRRAMGGDLVSIVYGAAGAAGYLRFLRAGIGLREDLTAPLFVARLLALRHRLWWRGSAETRTFLDEVARLRLLVAGRFHACTLALVVGTPFVAIASNTGKIASLVEDAGLDGWRLGVPLEPAEISAAAKRGWSPDERRGIPDFLNRTREAVAELFRDLRSLAQ